MGPNWAIDFHHCTKFCAILLSRNYGPKSKSKMAAVRHLEFLKTWFLRTGSPWASDFPSRYFPSRYKICTKMLIDTEIMGQNLNPRWRLYTILDLRKYDFWALRPVGLLIFYNCTKFGAKMFIDAEIMAQNRNPRWRPSAILDLSHHHIGPPMKSIHWATSAFQILL